MEGVRTRKVKSSSGKMGSGGGSGGSRTTSILRTPYRVLMMLVYGLAFILTAVIVLVSVNTVWPVRSAGHAAGLLDRVSVALGVQERVYAVIIDAGSTGTRVLAFTFLRSLADNSLKLEDQLWHEVKPGLSSYAEDPVKGAASLLPLLAMAAERIPAAARSSTPLVLKATAGLRLLPEHQADELLLQVDAVLQASEFHTTESSVGIMESKDEGIFSWFTVNYLMDRISADAQDTLVALDLGGGSTQITFVPSEEETIRNAAKEQLSSISLMSRSLQLFTHSYLGLGLMAARKDVLLHHSATDDAADPDELQPLLRSPCINPTVRTSWSYAGTTYTVTGPSKPKYRDIKGEAGRLGEHRPVADYEACLRSCVDVIKRQVTNVPQELKNREVIAFSYFFDRATERGLIDPYKGGVVTVTEFAQAARQTCDVPNVEQPFACLDLTFIAAFLRNGYELKPDAPVKLYKKIDGYEISWGLGLAFHVINNGI